MESEHRIRERLLTSGIDQKRGIPIELDRSGELSGHDRATEREGLEGWQVVGTEERRKDQCQRLAIESYQYALLDVTQPVNTVTDTEVIRSLQNVAEIALVHASERQAKIETVFGDENPQCSEKSDVILVRPEIRWVENERLRYPDRDRAGGIRKKILPPESLVQDRARQRCDPPVPRNNARLDVCPRQNRR
jgi:hypothetical protein